MKSQEEQIRQMLEELGQALAQAIQNSPNISETMELIRQEGYALHLVLGCMDDLEGMELEGVDEIKSTGEENTGEQESPDEAPVALPSFRVNTEDVNFLKSIGIDPTRAVRRRRKPRSLA